MALLGALVSRLSMDTVVAVLATVGAVTLGVGFWLQLFGMV